MMTPDRSGHGDGSEGETQEARIASLVADYLDRLHDGERLRSEDVLRTYPDLGQQIIDELRFYVPA